MLKTLTQITYNTTTFIFIPEYSTYTVAFNKSRLTQTKLNRRKHSQHFYARLRFDQTAIQISLDLKRNPLAARDHTRS